MEDTVQLIIWSDIIPDVPVNVFFLDMNNI